MDEEIIVFHASSFGRALQQIAKSFEDHNAGIKVILEGSGARLAARKVIEQRRLCDIVVSADYTIID